MKLVLFMLIMYVTHITSKTIKSPHCNDEKSNKSSENAAYSNKKQNNNKEIEVNDDIIGVETNKKTIEIEDGVINLRSKKKQLSNVNEGINSDSEKDSNENLYDIIQTNTFEKSKDNLPLDVTVEVTSGTHGIKIPQNEVRNRKSQSPIKFINMDSIDNMNDDKTRHNNDIIDIVEKTDKDLAKYTDINNIRQVREHLLDHLLDYFIKIIKEEELNVVTRKKNTEDKMKVEDKLRNYYSPEHIDEVVYKNDTETNDIDIDYPNGRRKSDDTPPINKDIGETTTITSPKDIYNQSDALNLIEQTKSDNVQEQEEVENETANKNQNKTIEINTIDNDSAVNDTTIETLPESEEFTTPSSIIIIEENSTESGEVTVSIETEIQEIETLESAKEQQPYAIGVTDTLKNVETGELIKEDSNSTENDSNSTTEAETFNKDITTEMFDINKDKTQNAVQNKSIDLIEDNHLNNEIESIATRKNNDLNIIELNKTIIIQKKPCADDKFEIDEDPKLSQNNCKKNIILQFNINM